MSGSTSLSAATARHPPPGPDPDEEPGPLRAPRDHRPVAHRAVGALEGEPGASSSGAATRTQRHRAYSLDDYVIAWTWAGRTRGQTLRHRGLASAAVPARVGHGSQPHGDRLALGHGPPGVVPVAPGAALTGVRVLRPEPGRARPRGGPPGGPLLGQQATRPSRSSGATAGPARRRYIYHGNDGTSFPVGTTPHSWTSGQARRPRAGDPYDPGGRTTASPVIRFDAAMVLAKRHVRRLVVPGPGRGRRGDPVTRRARHPDGSPSFEAAMPVEFWREVVDRVCGRGPDTLLLAEAFWMLEGYFVRTLGMHRVYNSAFMHMLRRRGQRRYRKVIKEDPGVRPGDPEALRQLHEQPGREDRGSSSSGRATSTSGWRRSSRRLPGLPMFGHGQFEGLRREVRDGVPAGDPGRAFRTSGSSPATSGRSCRSSTGGATSRRPTTSRLYDLGHGLRRRGRERLRVLQRLPAARGRWSVFP